MSTASTRCYNSCTQTYPNYFTWYLASLAARTGPSFCSTKITQDVRDYADQHGVDIKAAIPEGMREKSRRFEALGGEIYHESLPDA